MNEIIATWASAPMILIIIALLLFCILIAIIGVGGDMRKKIDELIEITKEKSKTE